MLLTQIARRRNCGTRANFPKSAGGQRGGGGLQTAESSHFSTRNRSPISRGVGLGKDNDMIGASAAPAFPSNDRRVEPGCSRRR